MSTPSAATPGTPDQPAPGRQELGGSRISAVLRSISARQWLALVLAALVLVFILQNRGTIDIDLLNVTISAPLWVVLLITALVGLLVGLLLRRRRRTGSSS